MDLKLVLNNSSSALYWLGVSGRELGKLGPGACMEVELTLLASTPGLQVCILYFATSCLSACFSKVKFLAVVFLFSCCCILVLYIFMGHCDTLHSRLLGCGF